MKPIRTLAIVAVVPIVTAAAALAGMSPARQAIFDDHLAAARAVDAGFEASTARGETFFRGKHAGGKADTPSCTSCHTSDLGKPGKSRAGKDIAPMAASVNPKRYIDAADVAKWLKRNCSDVLGRECTAPEKADVLAYLLSL